MSTLVNSKTTGSLGNIDSATSPPTYPQMDHLSSKKKAGDGVSIGLIHTCSLDINLKP